MQAQRDREREEQMMQQRQQQHYQNITTQQMFPKSPDATRAGSSVQSTSGAEIGLPPAYNADLMSGSEHGNGITLAVFAQQLDNKVASEQLEEQQQQEKEQQLSEAAQQSVDSFTIDQTDAGSIFNSTNGANGASLEHTTTPEQGGAQESQEGKPAATATATNTASNGCSTTTPASPTPTAAAAALVHLPAATTPPPAHPPATTTTPTPAAPVKKEKLGGFLPNGCIFPRFKNNKHKDKDSSNHKESKSKEKTLLNALKKSKEKKVAPSDAQTTSDNGTTQYEKNCINNLECEVQKLDLNNSNNDNNMFIKLKVAPSAASAPAAAATAAK